MGSPYLSRHRESDPQGKPMEVWVQERGKSEGSSVLEGIGVEQTRKITSRESGQTSTRSPVLPTVYNCAQIKLTTPRDGGSLWEMVLSIPTGDGHDQEQD